MVFISHANPEENDLALWISLQLGNAGYAVWCDLTKLLGGEKFWEDIQDAIRSRTAKFIFILSQSSNSKRGTLDELDCAIGTEKRLKAKDFILTLKTDSLAYDDIYIGIRRLNHIDFKESWPKGLARVLQKFEEDGVPKSPSFNPDAVCSWWRDQYSADAGIVEKPETVLSNWFKVESIPPILYEHQLASIKPGPVGIEETAFSYPAVWTGDLSFLTFAKAEDFLGSLGTNLEIGSTKQYNYDEVFSGKSIEDGVKYLAHLLRLAWAQYLQTRLPAYEMANKQLCFYFSGDLVKDDFIDFVSIDGRNSWRSVVGFKTLGKRVRHWHYGITGKPIMRPETLFVIKGHVLFSDDRKSLWESKEATSKARRSQCKNWWNDDWRDRLLATMAHLAGEQLSVSLPLASEGALTISKFPILFESPISYVEPKEVKKPEADDYAFEDEDEELDDPIPEDRTEDEG